MLTWIALQHVAWLYKREHGEKMTKLHHGASIFDAIYVDVCLLLDLTFEIAGVIYLFVR